MPDIAAKLFPNPTTMIVQLCSTAIMLLLFKKYLWNYVLEFFQKRADFIEKRKDFYLYVDEFQNFVTNTFADILSEARKYHLSLIMAHQYIAQLD